MNEIILLVGTRPEAIKMMPIYFEAKRNNIDVKLVSTGQHREMLFQVFEWFEVIPDFSLDVMSQDQSLCSLSSALLLKLDSLFLNFKNSILLVQGDTTSAFVGALAAFYHKIPVIHVEAGLRTYNNKSPWPEEGNRNLISKISDIHFAPTEWSCQNLINEGINRNKIFISGNTVIDALNYSIEKVNKKKIFPELLYELYFGSKINKRIVLITGHRRENWGLGLQSICNAISVLAKNNPDDYFIYPVHLNPNVKDIVFDKLKNNKNIILLPPLAYSEFISLMQRSYILLSDSGGVQEEAPSLGKPVLLMRDTTERPEGLNAGTVKLVGTDEFSIIAEVQKLLDDFYYYSKMSTAVNPYGEGNAAKIIVSCLKEFYATT